MSSVRKNQIRIHQWGLIDFATAWKQQEQLFDQNLAYKKQGLSGYHHLILCEHPPVYTIGKNGHTENLLISRDEREYLGADFYRINRGGDITFHGPGQLVVYPILDLESMRIGLKEYVFKLEEGIIQWLYRNFEIESERVEGRNGVWLGKDTPRERKIAAIGIKSSRYVTMHGAAINVNTDLRYFDYMVPCGIQNKGVTSVSAEKGSEYDLSLVSEAFVTDFLNSFLLEPIYA